MPITIKEIISSDSMSGMVEKVNFNFDQLILAGGGPPGIQGIPGIDGPIGPQGLRGDHWFTGPSALGQTADHDGVSGLRIQDHYLDVNGDVYEYYETSLGSTGWTASNINLRGPMGPSGADGGSLEWKIYLGATQGNIKDNESYGPSEDLGQSFTDIDFIIPNNSYKNSIFLGDNHWAYYNLKDFGKNLYGLRESTAVPKLTIIQNEIGNTGLNGISFGGPLIDGGANGASAIYGNSGATSFGGPTYSAYNFVNAAFVTERETPSSPYVTKWKIHSYKSNIKIQAGGFGGSILNDSASIELESGNTRIKDYTNDKFINLEKTVTFNVSGVLNANLREIQINSKPIINSDSSIDGSNTFGYVALQNSEGSGPATYSSGWPEHKLGSVIIGPTYNSLLSIPIATPSHQALAIVRRITKFDAADAAIRFFQPDIQVYNDTNAKVLTVAGSITPVRTTESAANVNGINGVLLDSLMINAGSFDITGNTVSSLGATAYNAGRLGLSNNTRTINKPQFPLHVSIIPDSATRKITWDGQLTDPNDRYIKYWFAGFDSKDSTTYRNPGIAFGLTQWKDDGGSWIPTPPFGGYWNSTPRLFTNPVIRTYSRLDSNQQYPAYQTIGFDDDYAERIIESIIGDKNPHLYIQPGNQSNYGNLGVGFEPGSTSYDNSSGAIDRSYISYAKAKLAVNGSTIIGSTSAKYHNYYSNVQNGGLVVQGLISQGGPVSRSLGSLRWKSPESIGDYFFGGGVVTFAKNIDDYAYKLQIGISTEKIALAKGFMSKGSPSTMYPDYALPDGKSGMGRMVGEIGVGALYADRTPYNSDTVTISDIVSPVVVAKFSATSDSILKNNPTKAGVGGFTVTNAFALAPAYYNIDTLPWYVANVQVEQPDSFTYNTHQIVYHQIPSKNSTAFIDLSSPMTSLPYFSSIGATGPIILSSQPTFLGGVFYNLGDPGDPGFIPLKPNSQQFTIEDGYYDGQILRIMILDVHRNNYSVLIPNAIPNISPYNSQTTYYNTYSLIIKDNIVMAAEKYSGATGTGGQSSWPLYPGTQFAEDSFGYANHRPWAMPQSIRQGIGYTGNAGAVTVSEINNAIGNAFRWYDNANNNQWTNISNPQYNTESATPNGSYFIMDPNKGRGAFKITPWRSITLQWKFDTSGGSISLPGCWYEIARENLVPRKEVMYSGSGPGMNSGDMVSDDLMGATTIQGTVPITYSFYNPTYEATMSILSNTITSSYSRSESGIVRSDLINYGVRITVPALIGNTNIINLRIKVIKTDQRTGYTSTILSDASGTFNGNTLTTLERLNIFTPEFGCSYSIECVALIDKK